MCASFSLQHPSGGSVLIFGGEVAPSDAGHEGAGSFAADLIAIDAADGRHASPPRPSLNSLGPTWQLSPTPGLYTDGSPLEVKVEAGAAPEARGWAAATAISETEAVLFGGLAGSDESPRRLGDAWRLSVEEA